MFQLRFLERLLADYGLGVVVDQFQDRVADIEGELDPTENRYASGPRGGSSASTPGVATTNAPSHCTRWSIRSLRVRLTQRDDSIRVDRNEDGRTPRHFPILLPNLDVVRVLPPCNCVVLEREFGV